MVKKEELKDWAILIDGSSFIYRAYFAIQGHLSTSRGFPTKAIFGVTQMLIKILREFEPQTIVWFADEKGPTFRHLAYAEYKAQRPGMPDDLKVQIPYIKKIVLALGIPFVSKEGFEADDLISAFVHRFPVKSIIVAPDKDLYALVSERTILYDPVRETFIDKEEFLKKFGFPPERFPEFRALVGDPSDNIKGVPGVGEKTAKELILRFKSLEELFENLPKVTPLKLREALAKNKERVFENLSLMRLRIDVELPSHDLNFYQRREPDLLTLKSLFKELEFKKFLKEFNFPSEEIEYSLLKVDEESLDRHLENLEKSELIGFSLKKEGTKLFNLGLDKEVFLAPSDKECLSLPINEQTLSRLTQKRLCFFDLKESLHELKKTSKVEPFFEALSNFDDIKLMAYLLDPGKKSYELSELAFHYLDVNLKEMDEPCKKAIVVRRLGRALRDEVSKEGLKEWYQSVEVPLSYVLFEMEDAGVKIDLSYVKELSQEFSERLKAIEEKLYELAGFRFNPRSPQEVAKVLFDRLKLPKVKSTPKGDQPSTDVEVLEELKGQHPIVEYLLQYRTLYKLKSTYLDAFLKQTSLKDHRLRTTYNQTGTATGRLSSQNPNLQNIPVKGEEGLKIRRAFIAEEGYYLCSLDYSQIELRILAHFSQDENLISSFLRGEDIHTKTACEVFGVKPEDVSQEMRRVAKVINFGIAYGMSSFGLAKELNIDRHSAELYIKRYFERYPQVKSYIDEVIKFAQETGYVKTISGRKRYIPEIFSPNKNLRDLGFRIAINTPIQGSAADLMKSAMVALAKEMKQRGLKSKILLQVHDELLLEVPEEELEVVRSLAIEVMEEPFPRLSLPIRLSVPIKVNFAYGRSWADCKEQ
ncbi:MAG: DNA polymerase I [Thermodesulfobacteriaceae bacterium]|jgi:DNA polymerase-1